MSTLGERLSVVATENAKLHIEIDKLSGREVKWLLPKGIKDALLDMEEGTKKILNLPPELAYGKSGASSFRAFFRYRVPPYSYMKIELELVKILN